MPEFTKTGPGDRLTREAATLNHVAHPNVVEVIGLEEGEQGTLLHLAHVDATALRTAGTPSHDIELFADIAATLAHIHQRGVAHTRLVASHILVRTDGRPVICGFAEASTMAQDDDSLAIEDVKALGALMTALANDPISRLRAMASGPAEQAAAARLDHLGKRAASGEISAATLCRLLRSPARVSNVPIPKPSRRQLLGAAAIVAGAVLLSGVVVQLVRTPSSSANAGDRTTTTSIPGTLIYGDGRFSVGSTTDGVVLGRWMCGEALPALLRKADGSVWIFNSWPEPGAEVRGRLVEGAAGITGMAAKANGECDLLAVTDNKGATRDIDLRSN